MANTWKDIVARKQKERSDRIPKAWLISPSYADRQSFLSVPSECGVLTPEELRLTEDYDATALLSGLMNGFLKSEDVTLAFCKRSAIAQQCCNCLTEIFYEDALQRAKELDEYYAKSGVPIGPLHGLPISLKDTFKVKGYDASIGYAALCFKPAMTNSALVETLLSLGAVLYCKTNVPQAVTALDTYNNVFGRTLNPRNKLLTPGGSSGGEGALIAMRGSILGVGTDVGGSIRVPSACNQLYGIKPSHGRIPYAGQESGNVAGSNKIGMEAQAGPLATSLRDCETFFQILCDSMPWQLDPDVIPQSWQSQTPLSCLNQTTMLRPLRVGIAYTDGHVRPLPPIQRFMEDVTRVLSACAPEIELVEVDLSSFGKPLLKCLNNVMSIDGRNTWLNLLEETGEPLSPWASTRMKRAPQKSLDEVRTLQAQRTELQKQFSKVWQANGGYWLSHPPLQVQDNRTLDVIVTPNAPHPIPLIDHWNTNNYSGMFNILDYPCGVLPVRLFSEKDLQGDVPKDEPLNSWDSRNREMWTDVDRRSYLDGPLNIQVVTPRLTERQLIEAMAILDEALAPMRSGSSRSTASKL